MQRNIEQYTQDYLQQDFNFENIMVKIRAKKVLEILHSYKPQNILEIGCGMESLFNHYRDFKHFTLVEPSQVFYKKALQDSKNFTNITLIHDFLENQIANLQQTPFDCIVCASLLHEVPNPQAFLQEIHNLVTKDCLVHINVPNAHSFHLLWAYESGFIKELGKLTQTAQRLQQHTAFTLNDLQELIVENTKKEVVFLDKGSYFIKPFNHAKMLECMQNNIITQELLKGLENLTKYFPLSGAEIYVNYRLS